MVARILSEPVRPGQPGQVRRLGRQVVLKVVVA